MSLGGSGRLPAGRGGRSDGRIVERLPLQLAFRLHGSDGRPADPEERDPRGRDQPVAADADHGRRAGEREVPVPAGVLDERETPSRAPATGIAPREGPRPARARSSWGRGRTPPPRASGCRSGPVTSIVAAEGERERRPLGGRIGVRDASTDGPPVPDRAVADQRQCVGEDGKPFEEPRRLLDRALAGHRPDVDRSLVFPRGTRARRHGSGPPGPKGSRSATRGAG